MEIITVLSVIFVIGLLALMSWGKTKDFMEHVVSRTMWSVYSLAFISLVFLIGFYLAFSLFSAYALSEEFIKYVATISFTLAGFTFISSFWTKEDKAHTSFEYGILMSCLIFLSAGFLNFAYLMLKYLPANDLNGNPLTYYSIFLAARPIFGTLGSFLFSMGLVWLFLLIFIRIQEINKKRKDEPGILEEYFKDFFGWKRFQETRKGKVKGKN